ncbi:MAG: F-box protein [Chlamydiales bacterium]|nr:F-box protein [Chlamydiales bacterium]
MSTVNSFEKLPHGCVRNTYLFLDATDAFSLRRVCKEVYPLIRSSAFFEKAADILCGVEPVKPAKLKQLYQECLWQEENLR